MRCTIYVLSGGNGASGEQIVRTALAQFDDPQADVIVVPHMQDSTQLAEFTQRLARTGGIVVHTFVDQTVRSELIERVALLQREAGDGVGAVLVAQDTEVVPEAQQAARTAAAAPIVELDLVGSLLRAISAQVGSLPLQRPGRYRHLRKEYFRRVEAIEYTVAHDDGCMPTGLEKADVVLVGVSRTGKTPLSMVLGMRGWRTANIPLVRNVPPPEALFAIDPRRVVGLTLDPQQLLDHRLHRQRRLGLPANSVYSNTSAIFEELEYARAIFRRGRFRVIDVTHVPFEESATTVIALVTERAGGVRSESEQRTSP